MTRTCAWCGQSFDTKGSHTRTTTCSRSCGARLAWTKRHRHEMPGCATCGKPVPRLHMLFCNRSCSGKSRRKVCGVDGCAARSESRSLGMCGTHARRHRAGIDLIRGARARLPEGERRRYGDGYVRIKFNGRALDEHRHVMQRQLGRELMPGETVHHRNGDKTDNRPENLELWTTRQPAGQRVADKVAWAVELLELYAPELLASKPVQLRLIT